MFRFSEPGRPASGRATDLENPGSRADQWRSIARLPIVYGHWASVHRGAPARRPEPFYGRHGFVGIYGIKRLMFLPMKTADAALKDDPEPEAGWSAV
jgi:hypothetical protein